jgi:hypothetical protein
LGRRAKCSVRWLLQRFGDAIDVNVEVVHRGDEIVRLKGRRRVAGAELLIEEMEWWGSAIIG